MDNNFNSLSKAQIQERLVDNKKIESQLLEALQSKQRIAENIRTGRVDVQAADGTIRLNESGDEEKRLHESRVQTLVDLGIARNGAEASADWVADRQKRGIR